MSNTEELLKQRGNQWGDAVGTHVRIAEVWSGITGQHITALQVALMMEGLKLVRASINPSDPDSFDDARGYGRIAELIAGHRDSLNDAPRAMNVVEITPRTKACAACGHGDFKHTRSTEGRYSCTFVTNGDLCICPDYLSQEE